MSITEPQTSPSGAISRSLKAVLAYHGMTVEQLDAASGLSKSNIYRRYKEGGWTADEVAYLSYFFGIPVEQFFSGRLDLPMSRIAQRPYRFSREHEGAGQEAFSGADVDAMVDALHDRQAGNVA